MAASCTNVDVVISNCFKNVPSCSHGPALLFERYTKEGGSQKFFACSAFRDKKLCNFFCLADDINSDDDKTRLKSGTSKPTQLSHVSQRKRFAEFKQLPVSERSLCCTCGLLLLPGERSVHEKQGHDINVGIKDVALRHPTTLFNPQENNKTFAQYLFAESTVDFVLTSLEKMNSTHILCVGAPRIHEAITERHRQQETSLQSLLLDLDARYAQVYSPKKMCLYNMFNHHFFDGKGESRLGSFLREAGRGLVLVTDPPFGGMVDPLAANFRKIEETWKVQTELDQALPILWFFPYFMEKRVCGCMPSLVMLDYKVDYDNHNLFKSKDGKRKKGSPVRIFTNLPQESLPLPASEGYRFCDTCQRYSASENVHCEKCQSCTSKDGTTYRHCDACERCVKSTRLHCDVCGMCQLPSHVCGQQRGAGCFVCGAMDHKRQDCPQKHSTSPRKSGLKRPAASHKGKYKSKKRRKDQ